jgi:hypothetical protein
MEILRRFCSSFRAGLQAAQHEWMVRRFQGDPEGLMLRLISKQRPISVDELGRFLARKRCCEAAPCSPMARPCRAASSGALRF